MEMPHCVACTSALSVWLGNDGAHRAQGSTHGDVMYYVSNVFAFGQLYSFGLMLYYVALNTIIKLLLAFKKIQKILATHGVMF